MKLPGVHVVHLLAPVLLQVVSSPHGVQSAFPAPLNLPAEHCVWTLPPVQNDPAGHCEHPWRVLELPSELYEPRAHVEQLLAPDPL